MEGSRKKQVMTGGDRGDRSDVTGEQLGLIPYHTPPTIYSVSITCIGNHWNTRRV